MNKLLKYIVVIILFSMLILIRAFEDNLFYDPLIKYFQNDYLYSTMPEVNTWKLVVDLLIRYTLNSLITLAIIYVFFRKMNFVKFAGFFLMLMFPILLVIFVFLVKSEFTNGYLFPFYIRRFIIHPLFLFLLLPAFYYVKFSKRK